MTLTASDTVSDTDVPATMLVMSIVFRVPPIITKTFEFAAVSCSMKMRMEDTSLVDIEVVHVNETLDSIIVVGYIANT